MESERLLVIVTGASAATILTAYLAELKARLDVELAVLMTTAAERFVSPEVVGWYADAVMTGTTPGLDPIEAALTARAIVVLPASANTLATAALGLMATPAATALAAAPSPSLYFPHMNGVLWAKPFVRQHVATLRERGDTVVDPTEREVFEIARRAKQVGPAMPGPVAAADIVRTWLRDGAAAPPREIPSIAAGARDFALGAPTPLPRRLRPVRAA